VKQGLPIRSQ